MSFIAVMKPMLKYSDTISTIGSTKLPCASPATDACALSTLPTAIVVLQSLSVCRLLRIVVEARAAKPIVAGGYTGTPTTQASTWHQRQTGAHSVANDPILCSFAV